MTILNIDKVQDICRMARVLQQSGMAFEDMEDFEAEEVISDLIGSMEVAFKEKYGSEYPDLIEQLLNEYLASRGLESDYEVDIRSFLRTEHQCHINPWVSGIIRRRGQDVHAYPYPALLLTVGLAFGEHKPYEFGIFYGLDYIFLTDSDELRLGKYVQSVKNDPKIRSKAHKLYESGSFDFSSSWRIGTNGDARFDFHTNSLDEQRFSDMWDHRAALSQFYYDSMVPWNIQDRIMKTFDQLLPLFKRICSRS